MLMLNAESMAALHLTGSVALWYDLDGPWSKPENACATAFATRYVRRVVLHGRTVITGTTADRAPVGLRIEQAEAFTAQALTHGGRRAA
jgi:hypothetical protein